MTNDGMTNDGMTNARSPDAAPAVPAAEDPPPSRATRRSSLGIPHSAWAAAFGLACLLVPGCSSTKPEGTQEQAGAPSPSQTAPQPGPTAGRPQGETPANPAPKKALATNPARRHPFASAIDTEARRAGLATENGPLELKGILQSEIRVALIQEGQKMHTARVGDHVGGLSVIEIRDGEVVLGAGPRKRVLPLYAPCAPIEALNHPREGTPR